jgi:hypothetical protein
MNVPAEVTEPTESTLAKQDAERQRLGLPPVGWEPPDNWIDPTELESPLPNDDGE